MYQVIEKTRYKSSTIMQLHELKRKILHCGITILCAAQIAGCGPHDSDSGTRVTNSEKSTPSQYSRTLFRGLLGEPKTLDPQLADDTYSSQVIRDMYEGLTAEGPDGSIEPGIASSWIVDTKGTAYTFQLRPNARWSNGDRIRADEVVRGLQRAVDPKTASGAASNLSVIKGAEDVIAGRKRPSDLGIYAISDSVLRIELEHPAPYILEILSQPTAAPMHAHLDSAPEQNKQNANDIITNGPYLKASRVPGSFIELVRNPNYWNASKVAIERVRYVDTDSDATELREYLAGQLDITFTIPLPDLSRMEHTYPKEVQIEPILATLYLALNLSSASLTKSLAVRQALSMSVDRELIAGKVMAGVSPAYSYVAKGIADYTPHTYEWSNWPHDRQLAVAKRLYEEAGYSQEQPLHLRLYFNQDDGIRRLMIAVAGSWKQNLGIQCELISDEFRVFLAGRKDKQKWDVARLGWTADYNDPSSFLEVFTHNSGQNDAGYQSAEFDKTIEAAKSDPEAQSRLALFGAAEEQLLNEYPIIPIYFYNARRLVKPYVGGAVLTPMNRTYTKHLFWKKDL